MKHLRQSLIVLLLAFAFFFNIERVDLGHASVVNIATYVYVIGLIAVLLLLQFPRIARKNVFSLIGFSLLVYAITWWMLDRGDVMRRHIYVLTSEIALLSLLVWLGQIVANSLSDFEEAVENITLSGVTRIKNSLSDTMQDIEAQMYLSRRYSRPLGVVVMEAKSSSMEVQFNQAIKEVQKALTNRYVSAQIFRVLEMVLRRTDVMAHNGNGRFILICPETSGSDLESLVARVREEMQNHLGVKVDCGVACFPDGALTFDELLIKAENELEEGQRAAATKAPLVKDEKVMIERG
jgi:GGDEF domain-containing protein